MNNSVIQQLLSNYCQLVDQQIESLLPSGEDKLTLAMRYSALSSGKRLRPFILLTTADMFNVDRAYSLRAAAAIEIIHSYSLIHDDLPAMDNDDFRRGMPSCHKKFDEATAILAGDSLLTLSFAILADPATHPDPAIRCNLITILAENIGAQGMAGGQMEDLVYERETLATYPQLVNMQKMKTAKLFMACCQMGAVLGKASVSNQLHLTKYAENFGLAFQFIDDLEDIKQNKPLNNNNIVKLIGEIKTIEMVNKYIADAREELKVFADNSNYLELLALHILAEIS